MESQLELEITSWLKTKPTNQPTTTKQINKKPLGSRVEKHTFLQEIEKVQITSKYLLKKNLYLSGLESYPQ